MKEVVKFTMIKPKVFEVDSEGIKERIIELEGNGNGFQSEIEYNVLKCFKFMSICMKNCRDYHAIDGFTQKSCHDYLCKYVKEIICE